VLPSQDFQFVPIADLKRQVVTLNVAFKRLVTPALLAIQVVSPALGLQTINVSAASTERIMRLLQAIKSMQIAGALALLFAET